MSDPRDARRRDSFVAKIASERKKKKKKKQKQNHNIIIVFILHRILVHFKFISVLQCRR